MKKLYIVLLIMLACVLTGCAAEAADISVTGPSWETDWPDAVPETGNPRAQVTCQYLPEKVENPDNLPVLKWVCLTQALYGSNGNLSQDAVVDVNAYLAQKNMPFRIQMVVLSVDRVTYEWDWLSCPEAQAALEDADLIYGYLSGAEMKQYLLPITQYAKGTAQPSLENAVPHEAYWKLVGDEIYGMVATLQVSPSAPGWVIDEAFFAQYGLNAVDFQKEFWQMDGVFASIYEKNGNQPFLYIQGDTLSDGRPTLTGVERHVPLSLWSLLSSRYAMLGGCYALEYTDEEPRVVNVLDTQYARDCQAALKRYKEAGYIGVSGVKISFGSVSENQVYTHGGKVRIPIAPLTYRRTSSGFVSGISAGTERVTEAASLLKLIAEDTRFQQLLFFGKEGRDYTVAPDGTCKQVTQADGSRYNMDMVSIWSYFCGIKPVDGNYLVMASNGSLQTLDEHLQKLSSARISPKASADITDFDFTALDMELNTQKRVLQDYTSQFSALDAEAYEEMLLWLEKTGGSKVLTALQKQLQTVMEE